MSTAETTYDRYRRVLEEIADGADNPQALATAALESRKVQPTYSWRQKAADRKAVADEHRRTRDHYAKEVYLDWLKCDHPPIAKYARLHKQSRSSMLRTLQRGERAMHLPWPEQRLSWSWRNSAYDKAGEIYKAKYGEEPHGPNSIG